MTYRTLETLDVNEVDMLTVVMVGSSLSQHVNLGRSDAIYTPRGYAKHLDKEEISMTVYFIGAGPGAPDLITVRGLNLIKSCPVCLYAGSLVPEAVVAEAPQDGLVMDTASLTLDDIMTLITQAHEKGQMLTRTFRRPFSLRRHC